MKPYVRFGRKTHQERRMKVLKMNLPPEDFVLEQRKSIERNHVILNMLFKCNMTNQ